MNSLTLSSAQSFGQAYLELCKPRVVTLMLLTSLVGMLMASETLPSWSVLWLGNLGIGLTAAAGAVFNHVIDNRVDALMRRTEDRPIPAGRIAPWKACFFGFFLAAFGLSILWCYTNPTTVVLSALSLIGYALIYTVYLKRATPQNIVIGGLAGAAPPLLGWTAVSGQIDAGGLLLMLIIFVWTPPHFWALAIHRVTDYAKVQIPMLPVTHGVRFTALSIVLYTVLLAAVTTFPYVIAMSGFLYLVVSAALNAIFLYRALELKRTERPEVAIRTFQYSITYLMALFVAFLVDHYLGAVDILS